MKILATGAPVKVKYKKQIISRFNLIWNELS